MGEEGKGKRKKLNRKGSVLRGSRRRWMDMGMTIFHCI